MYNYSQDFSRILVSVYNVVKKCVILITMLVKD